MESRLMTSKFLKYLNSEVLKAKQFYSISKMNFYRMNKSVAILQET